jgi:hypothetical protein
MRRATEWERGKVKWATTPSNDIWSSAKEWPTHVGGDEQRPLAPNTLHAMRVAIGNRGSVRDQATVPGVQTEMGR